MNVRRLPSAIRDVDDIYAYLAIHDPRAADRFVIRVERAIASIADAPGIGSPRPEKGRGVRKLSVRPYLIYYRVSRTELIVGRVVDGRRDLRRIRFRG